MDYPTLRTLIIAALIVVPLVVFLFAWVLVYVGARNERELEERMPRPYDAATHGVAGGGVRK